MMKSKRGGNTVLIQEIALRESRGRDVKPVPLVGMET